MIYDYITTKPPLNESTLAHYGVKGMKWGRRKKIRRKPDDWKKKELSELSFMTNTGLHGDPRYKKNRVHRLLVSRKGEGQRPSPQVKSKAFRYDPRYEYRESAISKNDSKYRTSRARPAVTSGMKYDPRYERKTGAVNVNKQNGDNRYTKKTTKAYDEQMRIARNANKIAENSRKAAERVANKAAAKKKANEITRDQIRKRYAKKK